jgi:uncharacterized protein YndB with AHSA1/START domain
MSSGVVVRRVFEATPERVFEAFADPSLVARWLRPSPEVELTVLAFDFRLDGAYRFSYLVPGGERMIVGGRYRVIVPPSRLVFSWVVEPPDVHAGIESEVAVTFVASAEGTEVTIRHDRWGRADADERHDQGWRGALDLLGPLIKGAG